MEFQNQNIVFVATTIYSKKLIHTRFLLIKDKKRERSLTNLDVKIIILDSNSFVSNGHPLIVFIHNYWEAGSEQVRYGPQAQNEPLLMLEERLLKPTSI